MIRVDIYWAVLSTEFVSLNEVSSVVCIMNFPDRMIHWEQDDRDTERIWTQWQVVLPGRGFRMFSMRFFKTRRVMDNNQQ